MQPQVSLSLDSSKQQKLTSFTSYCKRGDPTNKCRFGYLKPVVPATSLDSDSRCVYKRDVGDAYVNNYNPYLLATFRTSMDIQYSDGPQAVRYLAKYLAKDDYEAKLEGLRLEVGKNNRWKHGEQCSDDGDDSVDECDKSRFWIREKSVP